MFLDELGMVYKRQISMNEAYKVSKLIKIEKTIRGVGLNV